MAAISLSFETKKQYNSITINHTAGLHSVPQTFFLAPFLYSLLGLPIFTYLKFKN